MEKRRFTDEEVGKLVRLVEMGLDYGQIGDQLNRGDKSIEHKLYRIRQVLHPVKQMAPRKTPTDPKKWWKLWQ